MVEAYCMKCQVKGVTMLDPVISQTARGGYMAKGKCPKCATVLCAVMSKANAEAALASGKAKKGAPLGKKK
ncbi:MAG: hypothetical protein QW594_02380 [Candidatus Woesearchaeota archaeon]